jgi:hypothetical protein
MTVSGKVRWPLCVTSLFELVVLDFIGLHRVTASRHRRIFTYLNVHGPRFSNSGDTSSNLCSAIAVFATTSSRDPNLASYHPRESYYQWLQALIWMSVPQSIFALLKSVRPIDHAKGFLQSYRVLPYFESSRVLVPLYISQKVVIYSSTISYQP